MGENVHFRLAENTAVEVDSLGNELTNEQASYFRNSKVRDHKGNLLVCYHGTDSSFDTFEKGDIGFHFGTETAANQRREYRDNPEEWYVDKYYLNIENYIDTYDFGDWDGYTVAHHILESHLLDLTEDEIRWLQEIGSSGGYYDEEVSRQVREFLISKGIDGFMYENSYEDSGSLSYIVFNANQVKRISNKTPTSSSNLNEDLTLYRVGDIESGVFFADNLDYYDTSMTGYDKKDAKAYTIDLSNAKVFDPMRELGFDANTWSDIVGRIEDFEKYNIDYESEEGDEYGHTGTDEIAYAIKNLGYDVLILRDIRGDGGWGKPFNEYVVYNTSILKPTSGLTESITTETDSAGNELTPEQSAFFKNSKIRGYGNGKLLVCYHASASTFDAFDKSKIGSGNGGANYGRGFYFTPRKELANEYGEAKEYYLNITNPYHYHQNDKNTILSILDKSGYGYKKEYIDSLDDEFLLWDADLIDDILYFALIDASPWEALSDMLVKAGYDGIIADDEIIAFEPNQIKRLTTKTPTNSDNLNESMSNSISIDVAEAEEIATQFVSPTPTYQTWIDTQGRFLDASKLGSHYNMVDEVFWQLSDKGELNGVSPVDLEPEDYNEMTGVIFDSFSRAGWIQIGLDCKFASIFVKPTREQYDAIEKYLDYAFDKGAYVMEVCIENNGFHSASYNLKEVTPEYVVGRIKRCFSSGTLYEGVSDFSAFEKKCFDIALNVISQIESKLSAYGFEIDLVTDYEDYDEDFVGMFLASEQTEAKVFPIVVNPKVVYDYAESNGHNNNHDFIVWAIESTLWHEVGHGIVAYLSDMYDFDWDEEEVVEEFALNMCDKGNIDAKLPDKIPDFSSYRYSESPETCSGNTKKSFYSCAPPLPL